ncbi:putative nucleic acid-binding, replication factor A [Helianthus annuus]|uniref:Nucleic acid-binding, replication factor A n=1 Tax=Helianthus annuus TaxID=4232 RepID=A0A9K3HNT2_HELAN|nr:putative nucleic acid-binding, replication factor A [Helianthus annuus]KAJ0501236.1 putative nucleic acid-binding, replication factor A [Helianthus annuus]KAJ0517135.1 putative nucleic acid-binding, replication factor A [Helianthus annuus]KAJ0685143.1 putative nucleic acid-binding, replication factor A [Helianthus annuus]KAJ0870311.1 putative nucleic acid-binding, replication factor A [Helianthus annuus]
MLSTTSAATCSWTWLFHSCYRVSHYLSGEARDKYNVVKHDVILRLGKGTTFESIPDFGFPFHYFNFLPYTNLKERIDNHTILTDFIGRFVRFTFDRPTASNRRLLKFEVEDISSLRFPYGKEIADTIDKVSFTRAPFPAILALTSMKVGIYYDLQLTSTSATHVYLNPDNKTFSCLGSITEFIQGKSWYYKGCKKCNKKLDAKGSALACINHLEEKDPKFVYCVSAILADNTKTAMVTLFNDAILSLIDTPCVEMVTQHGYDNPQQIPKPLEIIRGKEKIFLLQFNNRFRQGTTSFVVNQVFDPPTSETPTIAQGEAISTPTTTPEIQPTTPAIQSTRKRGLLNPTDEHQQKTPKSLAP